MEFTGERAILGKMPGRMRIAQEHLARYNFALGILEEHGCKTVLDAACGSGYGTWLLSQNGFQTSGADISKEAIEAAWDLNNVNGKRFSCISLDNPDESELLRNGQFDAIVSFETIEHLQNPDKFLEWVKRKTDLFIFSLPINQPSEFHLTVYPTAQDAVNQIKKHFKNLAVFSQEFMNFYGYNESGADYIVGYAKK